MWWIAIITALPRIIRNVLHLVAAGSVCWVLLVIGHRADRSGDPPGPWETALIAILVVAVGKGASRRKRREG